MRKKVRKENVSLLECLEDTEKEYWDLKNCNKKTAKLHEPYCLCTKIFRVKGEKLIHQRRLGAKNLVAAHSSNVLNVKNSQIPSVHHFFSRVSEYTTPTCFLKHG